MTTAVKPACTETVVTPDELVNKRLPEITGHKRKIARVFDVGHTSYFRVTFLPFEGNTVVAYWVTVSGADVTVEKEVQPKKND